jgi:predicted transcriptional regulator
VRLTWDDVTEESEFAPDVLYRSLEENDLRILKLHLDVGLDYSLKVARILYIDKQEVFERHKKLLENGLLKRVPKVMIRYRKGVVDNKWIKHRNHTYYELTRKGRNYIAYYERTGRK